MNSETHITMKVFRKRGSLDNLSADDRLEIFCDILKGSSDITRSNLNRLGANYDVDIDDLYKDDVEIMKRKKALAHHLDCDIKVIDNNIDTDYPDEFHIGRGSYEVVTKAVAITNRFECDNEFDYVVDFVVAYVTDDCVEGMYIRMKDSQYFVREL